MQSFACYWYKEKVLLALSSWNLSIIKSSISGCKKKLIDQNTAEDAIRKKKNCLDMHIKMPIFCTKLQPNNQGCVTTCLTQKEHSPLWRNISEDISFTWMMRFVKKFSWFKDQPKELYAAGIQKLIVRWGKCVTVAGYDVKKIAQVVSNLCCLDETSLDVLCVPLLYLQVVI